MNNNPNSTKLHLLTFTVSLTHTCAWYVLLSTQH